MTRECLAESEAFDNFYFAEARGLQRFLSICLRPQLAEEFAQDCWMKIYPIFGNFDSDIQRRAYLYKVAGNAVISHSRKARDHFGIVREVALEADADREVMPRQYASRDSNPEQLQLASELLQHFARHMRGQRRIDSLGSIAGSTPTMGANPDLQTDF